MNDTIAALLYVLGRHVTTSLRVRREDEEIVLSRHQAPPLRELHEALEHGEQLAVDPWVDLEDGTRGLVCLWARTPCPEVTAEDLPAGLGPQAWIRHGGTALAVWSLAEPTARPGGIDPARAMREIAAALGITACDSRDYIPVPRNPGDIMIVEPGRDTDAVRLVRWAQGVLAEKRELEQQRREQEEAVKLTALRPQAVRVLAAIADVRRAQEETASRAALGTAEQGDAQIESPQQPKRGAREEPAAASELEADTQPAVHSDPWATVSQDTQDTDSIAPTGRAIEFSPEPEAPGQALSDIAQAALRRRRLETESQAARGNSDSAYIEARSRLAAAIADALKDGWDESRLRAMLVEAMATLGTREVWAALGVGMTWFRDGTLYGLCNGHWVRLQRLLLAERTGTRGR